VPMIVEEGAPSKRKSNKLSYCLTTKVFQQRKNTFSNHSHKNIKDQHVDVLT
jgi:hypothetical protein